jgi:hypothetical protein
MDKVIQIFTIPEVRHKFAHRVGMFGIAIGWAGAIMIWVFALLS